MVYLLPCELNAFSLIIRFKKVENGGLKLGQMVIEIKMAKKTKSFWKLELKINSIVFYDLSEAPHVSRSLLHYSLVMRANTGNDSLDS